MVYVFSILEVIKVLVFCKSRRLGSELIFLKTRKSSLNFKLAEQNKSDSMKSCKSSTVGAGINNLKTHPSPYIYQQ